MDERSIIWSVTALSDLKKNLKFYRTRNGNWNYSFMFVSDVRNSLNLLSRFAWMGKKIQSHQHVRVLAKGNFSILYMISEAEINLLVFWDNRQDPEKLDKILS